MWPFKRKTEPPPLVRAILLLLEQHPDHWQARHNLLTHQPSGTSVSLDTGRLYPCGSACCVSTGRWTRQLRDAAHRALAHKLNPPGEAGRGQGGEA